MMQTIALYMVRQTIGPLVIATLIALFALSLERMLRLLDMALRAEGAFFLVMRMLVNLAPNYLGIALPAAFFLGVLLAFGRLSQDNELAALNALGFGLPRLVLPIMGLAVVLTALAFVIFGFLQPYGRYAYRALVYQITNAPISAVLPEDTFITINGMTFMADEVARDTLALGKVFLHEEEETAASATVTARLGMLRESRDGQYQVLLLRDGLRVAIAPEEARPGLLSFSQSSWAIEERRLARLFRPRGEDEKELTLIELWQTQTHGPLPPEAEPYEITAELHARLVRTASILVLPLLAAPLGLTSRRTPQSYGVVLGLILLFVYHEVLQFGAAMADEGEVSPWIALWLPWLLLSAGSLWLFVHTSSQVGAQPLLAFAERTDMAFESLRAARARLRARA